MLKINEGAGRGASFGIFQPREKIGTDAIEMDRSVTIMMSTMGQSSYRGRGVQPPTLPGRSLLLALVADDETSWQASKSRPKSGNPLVGFPSNRSRASPFSQLNMINFY